MERKKSKFQQKLDEMMEKQRPKESSFFDLPKDKSCKDREHNPPSHMVIPQGKGYRHVCPSCGEVQIVIPTQISL